MMVCHCKRVTERTVRDAVRSGAECAEEVGAMCRAGTDCGGCRPLVEVIVEEECDNPQAEPLPAFERAG